MTLANAKPDLLITGPLGTSMVNAASSAWHDYLTVEAKLTAAIAYAVSLGANYCHVPISFLPYTAANVTFNTGVQLVREGQNPGVIDIQAYGADPQAGSSAVAAIQAAINAAAANASAGGAAGQRSVRVFAPSGTYVIDGLIAFPPNPTQNIEFVGEHWRNVAFTVTSGLATAFRWGSATRDNSGTSANITQYGRLANFAINANAPAAGTNLLDIVEADGLIIDSVLLQGASTGHGLRLLGSITSSGYGGSSGPQVRGCHFSDVRVSDCLYPLQLNNAEDNKFDNCEFRCTKGSVAGANTVFGIECVQTVGNRFFRTYISGDTAGKTPYVGLMVDNPVNGVNAANEFYGLLIEGCNRPVWINDAGATQAVGTVMLAADFSLNNTPVLTNNTNGNGTKLFAPLSAINYYSRMGETKETSAVPFSASVSFNATVGDMYQIGGTNTSAWTLNAPTSPTAGQFILIEFQNASGGVMAVPTLDAVWKTNGALVMPANNNRRVYGFHYDGSKWRETFRATVDQPN